MVGSSTAVSRPRSFNQRHRSPQAKPPGDTYGIQTRLDNQSSRIMAASTDGELKTAKGRGLLSTVENIQAAYTADLQAGGGRLSAAQLQQLESQLNRSNAAIFLARQHAQVNRAKPHGSTAEPWRPGRGQLHGGDTSNWNSNATFQSSIQGSRWTALKASQGTSYTDPTFASRWNELGKKVASGQMSLRMAYGFLDPGVSGAAQAQHFLDVVGVHGPLPAGTRLALDWEGAALNDPGVLRDAANCIHKVTGTWPVIYVQGSMMSVAKATVPQSPIWEAAYGSGIKTNVPFFQYSDGPNYDQDVFNGSKAALRKFAGFSG